MAIGIPCTVCRFPSDLLAGDLCADHACEARDAMIERRKRAAKPIRAAIALRIVPSLRAVS